MRRRFLWFCCKHRSLKDTSGHFLKKITNTTTSTSVPLSTFVTMEASADFSMDSGHAAGVYNCPQSGCIRVFQRVSTSETDLSLECALVPGAQSSGPSSSPGWGPYCVQSDSLLPEV